MAEELLAFPAAAPVSIHKGGDGEFLLDSMQYQSHLTSLESELIQNGEAKFQREIDRVLETILLKVSPSGHYTSSTPVTVVVELTVPVVKFPDGGRRCPYFPCLTCHRSRSLFPDAESRCNEVSLLNFDSNSELYTCESAESEDKISSHRLCPTLIMFPDKGHKCEEFPCPICHKNDRSG